MNKISSKASVFAAAILFWTSTPAQAGDSAIVQVMMIEFDPWNSVIGSDSPTFAMYDDGEVIFRTDGGYKSVRLAFERQSEIRNALSKIGEWKNYQSSTFTDQPTTVLAWNDKPSFRSLSIYGSLRRDKVRSKLPPSVIKAYDLLKNFDDTEARNWLPAKIEVMIWPYDYAPEPSIVWPRNWPGIEDPETIKRGDSYSIYLPSTYFEELKTFAASRHPRGAVEIGGKKWSLSWRFPFPGERTDEDTRP